MHLIVARDYQDLSLRAARRVADYINCNPGELLCLAAGDTPLGALEEMIRMQEREEVDLASVFYAGLDEWVGLGPGDKGSCHQVMFGTFYGPAGIPRERIHVFDGLDPDPQGQCREMERWIAARGGIGLTLLGVGLNGHVGFNEPDTPPREGCIVVPLDSVTRGVSVKYFGSPRPVEQGITVSWVELKKARSVVVMAGGEGKADIMRRSFCEPMNPGVPASLFQDHGDLDLFVDEAAAAAF